MRQRVKKAYQDWAKTYDQELNPSIDLEKNKVMKLLHPKKGERILDVGCGTGRYLRPLVRKGTHATGIDFSRNMLEIARKKAPHADIKEVDITKKFPFPSSTFDKVICSLVISHIKNIIPVLKEIKRVLKDDGFLILTTLHPNTDFSDYELMKFDFPLSRYDCSILHSFLSLEKSFKESGLKEEERLELHIDESISHCFTKTSFKKVKGRPKGVIFKLIN